MAHILIAGGSLGGLMCANLLARAGHQVSVFEKAASALDDRGAGIVTHSALIQGLYLCGMPVGTELGVSVPSRITLGRRGDVLGELNMPQVLTSWSRIYQILHGLLHEASRATLHRGVVVYGFTETGTGVNLHTSTGDSTGDLLIGCDGLRSSIRRQLWPASSPVYAGYVAWRGVCPESLLSHECLSTVFERFGFCLPAGEQLIGYPIAGPDNQCAAGHRAWNFVWYRAAASNRQLESLLTDDNGQHHPEGIAPHKVSRQQVEQMRNDARNLLAPVFAEIVEKTLEPFLQPVSDLATPHMVQGRVALLGDAAYVARPHVGMGVTKAMQDALALETALSEHGAKSAALAAYSEARTSINRQLVDRGRYLGAYMQSSALEGSTLPPRAVAKVMSETAIDLDSPAAKLV